MYATDAGAAYIKCIDGASVGVRCAGVRIGRVALSEFGLVRIAWLMWLGLALSPTAAADGVACGAQPVVVETRDERLQQTICAAATQAVRFLERYGLRSQRAVRINVVEHPLVSAGHPVYGCYDSRTDRIEVMSADSILSGVRSPKVYGQPFNIALYRSVVAHEVAHAVAQQNRRAASLTTAAQEYLAHATQLGVLPEALRSKIIAAAGVGPWEPGDVVSDAYMAMAPTRFAVKCYLHLMGHPNPRAFVQVLLSAKWRYITID